MLTSKGLVHCHHGSEHGGTHSAEASEAERAKMGLVWASQSPPLETNFL